MFVWPNITFDEFFGSARSVLSSLLSYYRFRLFSLVKQEGVLLSDVNRQYSELEYELLQTVGHVGWVSVDLI